MNGLAKLLNGQVRKYGITPYLEVRRELDDIDKYSPGHKKITDYIRDNLINLHSGRTSGKLNRIFPGANLNLSSNLIFLDIETCGLEDRMINTISLAKVNGNIEITTYFAVNPYSEEAILTETLDKILSPDISVFTYNGTSFDISRINARAVAWGAIDKQLRRDKQKPLFTDYASPAKMAAKHSKEHPNMKFDKNYLATLLNGRHHDLMHLFKNVFRTQQGRSRDRRLQTLEKTLFHTHRENEIEGRYIPDEYERFLYYGDNQEAICRVIEHNVLDTVSLIALLEYLCAKEK